MTGHRLAAFALLCAAALQACSPATDDKAAAPVTNPSWITGTWTGILTNADKEADLKSAAVNAVFAPDADDKTDRPGGTFELTFPTMKDTHSKGTFKAVGDDVMLNPTDSSLSLIAQN
jgi:hypothetical protein